MVAPGFCRGQGWFSGGGVDRRNTNSGAEVESRLAGAECDHCGFRVECNREQSGTQASCPLSIEARQQEVTHKDVSRNARSPILDRSPSRWSRSLQCAFQLPEEPPIFKLHFSDCCRIARTVGFKALAGQAAKRATKNFSFELVFRYRHILNLIRKQSCFRQTSSVSSGS